MQLRSLLLAGIVTVGLVGVAGNAQNPQQNVNPNRHPNLAAAQRLSEQAYQKIIAAQQANEWDMAGHAAKAKELLDQVNRELAQAAGAANRNK
jgi:hypothetical protein